MRARSTSRIPPICAPCRKSSGCVRFWAMRSTPSIFPICSSVAQFLVMKIETTKTNELIGTSGHREIGTSEKQNSAPTLRVSAKGGAPISLTHLAFQERQVSTLLLFARVVVGVHVVEHHG